MEVTFKRTGERRYAVIVRVPGQSARCMNPAPGYDDHIPHDLVHYVVEAELGLTGGVFGRAAQGAGSFLIDVSGPAQPRARARAQRKQRRREHGLGERDAAGRGDMATSERLAALCDLAWRRRHGQRPNPALWKAPEPLSGHDQRQVELVLERLDRLASAWSGLHEGGELCFVWPSSEPMS